MKQLHLFIAFLLLSCRCLAQSPMDKTMVPYQPMCPDLVFCTDSLQSKALFKGSLTKYCFKEINWRKLEHIKGVIVVRVAVDSAGIPCCRGYFNYTANTNEEIADIWIDDLIYHMHPWKPAISNGKPVNSMRNIAIYCRVKDHDPFEVNYFNGVHSKIQIANNTGEDVKLILDYDEMAKISGK